MTGRGGSLLTVAAVAFGVAAAMATVTAQSAPAKPKAATGATGVERTPDGHPDLQGVWANNVVTPLQRPKHWEGKKTLTEAEIRELQQVAEKIYENDGDAQFGDGLILAILDRIEKPGSYDPGTGNYNQFWIVGRDWHDRRTSLITDPPDGKMPAMTPAAEKRRAAERALREQHAFEDPELFPAGERCVNFQVPRMGAGYNSYMQIVQSPGYVTIMAEMAHDARVIPTNGSAHPPKHIQFWNGDSRGRWEGDTLVVDIANFSPKTDFMGAHENLHIVERYTRVSADVLNYEVTVDDPTTWTRPWTAMIPLKFKDELIYEYACHEANDSLLNMLKGHRWEEKQQRSGEGSSR